MLLKVFPGLSLIANQCQKANALALWYVCRAADTPGSGHVTQSSILEIVSPYWTTTKYYRALKVAKEIGLIETYRRGNGTERWLKLSSAVAVGVALSVSYLGTRPVYQPLECIRTASTFRAAQFGAFHAGRGKRPDSPISRRVMRDATGLSRVTQNKYEKKENISKRRNRLDLNLSPDHLTYARDHIHPGCFIADNKVMRPLPNDYRTPHETGSKSRILKINRAIRRLLINANGDFTKPATLFYDTADTAEQGGRENARRAVKVERIKSNAVTFYPLALYRKADSLWGVA